jgi:5-methylcytosine-specific restriction endonuclease McrA
MSKTNLKIRDKWELYFKCGGLCSLCCDPLDYDKFSRSEINVSEYAHIIADSEEGTRGSSESKKNAGDIDNIILLCPTCHTKVDKDNPPEFYTVERLHIIKNNHEQKVREQLSTLKNEHAMVVKYTSKIGNYQPTITDININEAVRSAGLITPRYPIDLNPNNTAFYDDIGQFWASEWAQLQEKFRQEINVLREQKKSEKILLFAIAPIPLLIRLGMLFGDITEVDVFQKHRESDTWAWLDGDSQIGYEITIPTTKFSTVAVKLSLSDNITDDRIQNVLGNDISIWNITHQNPNNDYIKSREDLATLRGKYRELFRLIREYHGQNTVVHVFPACPVSAAVEFGRVYMPKADARLVLYDQNNKNNGFSLAFDLS